MLSTESESPIVSVIVPAYNSERTIARCMRCLADQRTSHAYEVVLVDSGSDRTAEIAKGVLPDVRVVRVAERAIPPRARNIGAAHARGSILGFVDADAYLDSGAVDAMVEGISRGYDLMCGAIENANPESLVSRAEQLLMFSEFLPGAQERESWFALSGNMALSRHAFERFGPFVEVRAAEDVVFSRRLIERGGRILFSPKLVARHENRTRLRPFLRNQLLLGRHTAVARRLVTFADRAGTRLLVAALPVAPLVKLAKVVVHVARGNPRMVSEVVRTFPVLALGTCAYAIGLARGAFERVPSSEGLAGAPIEPANG